MQTRILVGDIGSTKSTWYQSGGRSPLHLPGYNPLTQKEVIANELFNALKQHCSDIHFDSIWYYGAGITGQQTGLSVREKLESYFPGSRVHVASDLEGAAKAAFGDLPGALAILGTGSHAAIWDGQRITRQANSLGYILGDEGSGCDIGKALIRGYFYNELPEILMTGMAEVLPGSREAFLTAFAAAPAPNQFLADFAKVAVRHQNEPWVQEYVTSRFGVFIQKHIIPLGPVTPVHIIGSIGSIFAGLIRNELSKEGFLVGDFIPNPAERLFGIHQ